MNTATEIKQPINLYTFSMGIEGEVHFSHISSESKKGDLHLRAWRQKSIWPCEFDVDQEHI